MRPVTMDALTESTTLVSRLGPQSWHFFVALQIETEWLSEPVSTWSNNTTYQRFHKFAHNLPISNDSTERIIKRTSDYSNFGTKNEDDFQAILSVVGQAIERLPSRSTKAALVKAHDK